MMDDLFGCCMIYDLLGCFMLTYLWACFMMDDTYQLLNVLPCNMQCCSPEVGMLPEPSAEGNIPTKGGNLFYHYHINTMFTCTITVHVKGN